MDIVCSDCTFYNRDICKIFLCKSYLEVTCGVSDLCTADGKQVLAGYIDGIQSTRGSSTKLEEIVQEHPLNATWSIWWRFMKKHIHHPDKECWLKLGWLLKANKMHRLWLFPYSTTYNRIIMGDTVGNGTTIQPTATRPLHALKTPTTSTLHPPKLTLSLMNDNTRHMLNDIVSSLPIDAALCNINDTIPQWEICNHYPYIPAETPPPSSSHPPSPHILLASQSTAANITNTLNSTRNPPCTPPIR